MGDTKTRILDSAERLFAAQGYAATTLRQVIAGAGVNLAAVNYHFRSKEGLLEAVVVRGAAPVNAERLAMLDECERAAGRRPPKLEGVLRAFLTPTFALLRTNPGFVRLMGRLHVENDLLPPILVRYFSELTSRFGAALGRARPDLPPQELFWRMHFAIGAMAQTLSSGHELAVISGGLCDPQNPDEALDRLLVFLVAGFRAPAGAARRRSAK